MGSRVVTAVCTALLAAMVVVASPASAEAEPGGPADGRPAAPRPGDAPPPPAVVAERDRGAVLGDGWQTSDDLLWTTSGDATGFHVLAAAAEDGYAWRTVASLSEPGFDTDMWIGNACLTGSGERMVVVYAPRTFTNRPDLFARGGFTAVVDVASGTVEKLPITSTLAYFNPGCGTGEQAVVSQGNTAADEADSGPARTRLTMVDAKTAAMAEPVVADGQLTSAVPVEGGIVAAAGASLVTVAGSGRTDPVVSTGRVPFRVSVDAGGGVIFHERTAEDRVAIRRLPAERENAPVTLATGRLGAVRAVAGAHGRVFLTGDPERVRLLPATVTQVGAPAGARVSSHGEAAVTETVRLGEEDPRVPVPEPDLPRAVRVSAVSLVTGAPLEFGVAPTPAADTERPHPGLWESGERTTAATTNWVTGTPVDADRWCSIPRNDRTFDVLQPKPRQVEWAINQAVTNSLDVQRPADWRGLGMGAYQPQQMFPSIPLLGGGRVHSQVMLGIAAQESNMWQASNLALPGMTGNPLVGNFYGLDILNGSEDDDWDIDWTEADCGYGVMQVTDGMRLAGHEKPGQTARPWSHQQAIAADFAANVAAGLQILQDKWNQTRNAGMIVGEGRPSGLENWYFALWAYNSGFYPEWEKEQHNGAWGVGWANNPINPHYPPDRPPFMEYSYGDAAHPQDWPYQEKVIGFAGHPPEYVEEAQPDEYTYVAAFRPSWWTQAEYRVEAKAPSDLFCTEDNDCYPGEEFDRPPGDDEPWLKTPCAHTDANGDYDLKCWWHQPTDWKQDEVDPATGQVHTVTGFELLRFDPGYEYQENGQSFPPACTTNVYPTLPADALVVDDMPKYLPNGRADCAPQFDEAGSFTFSIPTDPNGTHPATADLHQLSGGFNSHFWFSHTRDGDHNYDGRMRLSGTWRFDAPMSGWGRVLVHLPSVAAHTQQAAYEIDLGDGFDNGERRVILQRTREHRWVSLGAFEFDGVPRIRLSNFTHDGTGDEDVAWDAVAIQPLPGKPAYQIVSLGDSYSSGEGASIDADVDYYPETDFKLVFDDQDRYQNACHRSRHAWPRLIDVVEEAHPIGEADDIRRPGVDHHLLACSGARTHQLLPYHSVPDGQPKPTNAFDLDGSGGGGGNNSELTQLDRGFLNEDTTLVTLSIGGNDAGFSDVVRACFLAGYTTTPCAELSAGDVTYGELIAARLTSAVRDSVQLVLEQVHARAPNADILLMGYPHLFGDETVCGVRSGDRQWLADMADLMNQTFSDLALELSGNGTPVTFVDPTSAFAGHGVCGDDDEWIHAIILDKTRGESSGPGPSQQSFHPKIPGAQGFADLATTAVYGLTH